MSIEILGELCSGPAGKNLVVEVSTNVNAIIKRVALLGRNGLFYACGMALTLLSKREDILSFCCG